MHPSNRAEGPYLTCASQSPRAPNSFERKSGGCNVNKINVNYHQNRIQDLILTHLEIIHDKVAVAMKPPIYNCPLNAFLTKVFSFFFLQQRTFQTLAALSSMTKPGRGTNQGRAQASNCSARNFKKVGRPTDGRASMDRLHFLLLTGI